MQAFEIGDCISDDDDFDDSDDNYGNTINDDEYNDDYDNNHNQGRTRRQERRQQRRTNRQQQLYQLRKSQSAIDRIRKYTETQNQIQLQQQQQLVLFDSNTRSKGRSTLLFKSIGSIIQKVNIGNWIDELEVQQEIKDKHNRTIQEEQDRQKIINQAHNACMNSMKEHLSSFLNEYSNNTTGSTSSSSTLNVTTGTSTTINPESAIEPIIVDTNSETKQGSSQSLQQVQQVVTYEDWINELHPDNIITKKDGSKHLDERYYLIDSDHRLLWNEQIQLIELQQQQQLSQAQLQHQSNTTGTITSNGASNVISRIVQPRSMI